MTNDPSSQLEPLEPRARSESERRLNSIGFAHIIQVTQVLFILFMAATFIWTKWDLESYKATATLDRTNIEIRVGIIEKTQARQETEIHDYIVQSGTALQKINDALTDLRLRSGQGKRG